MFDNSYMPVLPPPPPLPYYDLLLKHSFADKAAAMTMSGYCLRDEPGTTYLTGGRSKSERVMPQHINKFVSKERTGGMIKTKSIGTFFERLGMSPTCHLRHTEELSVTTPYSFVTNHCKDIRHTRDDNVIINPGTKTVLKFLRSKKSVRGFLMSMYIASAYSDLLGLAKCVAYYPSLMCAEYEYVGENVDTVIKRQLSVPEKEDYDDMDVDSSDINTIIFNQMVSIMNDITFFTKMTPMLLDPSNFCIDLASNKVKMTCTEWLVPSSLWR
nr:MAG: protein kinase [Hemigrapsus takanoi nimavirus]